MTAFKAVPKAMWVNLVTIDQIADVITYANSIGCKHLFYGIGANSAAAINGMKSGKPTASFQAMQGFKTAGGKIWLMGGTVGWLKSPGTVPAAAATIIAVINGNPGLFAGIHLDVEPWDVSANPTWPTTKVQDCQNLYTLYGTVKTALPANAKISAASNAVCAKVFPTGSDKSFLHMYQNRLHEIAMMFYWNTLAKDESNSRAARDILNQRKNWWFGQSFKQGGSGSWWKANPNTAANRTAMAAVWDEIAKPSNAKGIALYTYNDLPSQLPAS